MQKTLVVKQLHITLKNNHRIAVMLPFNVMENPEKIIYWSLRKAFATYAIMASDIEVCGFQDAPFLDHVTDFHFVRFGFKVINCEKDEMEIIYKATHNAILKMIDVDRYLILETYKAKAQDLRFRYKYESIIGSDPNLDFNMCPPNLLKSDIELEFGDNNENT